MNENAIEVLGRSARFDICSSDGCFRGRGPGRKRIAGLPRWIYPAVTPDGRTVLMMKVLMSNQCHNSCAYCANRLGGRDRPAEFTPDELVRTFLDLHQRGLARGLFLSSAVCDHPNAVMDRMIAAVEMLRRRHRFTGYVHLKILPGAAFDRVERAVELADRVSLNLEAPGPDRLRAIAGEKDFQGHLLTRMRWVRDLMALKEGAACRGQTTQFVVGAAGESDREIVTTVARIYRELRLERSYFSAFQPLSDTPLEGVPPTPLMREHRLYQVDFLFRRYRWTLDDIVFGEGDNLSLTADPKLAWAAAHPERFPIEVNRAPYQELLRVPGMGPKSAQRVVAARRQGRLTALTDLRAMGAVTRRAGRFVLLNGRRPDPEPGQLAMSF
jgi:predicted DNA-binding helix-hairpin-helix protein